MATASEHARTLLSAIIPARRDLLDRATRYLTPEHFLDPVLRNVFVMLCRYADVTGAIMSKVALGDMLTSARADAGKVALYNEQYDLLAATHADDAQFRWSLEQIRELSAERATGEALTQAMAILTGGATGERGELLRGHAESRKHVLTKFAEIDHDLSMMDSPEGDMRAEAEAMLADYAERKAARAAGRNLGVSFGIPALDEATNGLQRGELCLLVGYPGEGKTSSVVQLGWNAVVCQGLNVVILTTETLRAQVRRRIEARHSCLPQFGVPGGLNSRDIKTGLLSPTKEETLRQVIADFTANPGYGRCWITQVPHRATVGYLESKLLRLSRMFPIDLVIMDYLALLRADRKRRDMREELSDIIKEAKQLATTFNDGYGVPFVSPWQVSRAARREAEKVGYYTSDALAETAEATNSADVIISLLAPQDHTGREANLRMQVMKNRDGERASAIDVGVDYATSRFSERRRGQAMDHLLGDDIPVV